MVVQASPDDKAISSRDAATCARHFRPQISTIGLGSWAIGGWMWGEQDDTASETAIHAAVDHGVNWIDTAPIYGGGHSETIVGRAMQGAAGVTPASPSSRSSAWAPTRR